LLPSHPAAGEVLTMFQRSRTTKHERRIAELGAEVETLKRQLKVSEAERESLSLVIARDRERIKAELAAYAKATGEKQ
jgi:hypothetical protein